MVGGSEISQTTAGARGIYMGVFRVPPGAQSRPHCGPAIATTSKTREIRRRLMARSYAS